LIVLDASAVVDYLVDAGERGEWVRDTIKDELSVSAPHLIDVEVLSALRKRLEGKELSRRRAEDAIADFRDLALIRYPATPLLDRIWELRSTLTAYDAAYVSLSEALGTALVTTDVRLGRSHGHVADIVCLNA
jgi:predicted nucleic acid-binding protein